MTITELQHIIDDYLTIFPDEAPGLKRLQERLDIDEIFNNRKSFQGHGTGGAMVLSPDKKKILLVHHRILDRWIQPGGHWDPDEPNPWTVARREAQEETKVHIRMLIPIDPSKPHIPVHIRSYDIPASDKKQEPAHTHHDFRYIFLAASEELHLQQDEVSDAQWIPLDRDDPRLDEMQPVIRKMRALHII